MESVRRRWIEGRLRAALKVMPVVVLTGARQVGKTTLAVSLTPIRHLLTLDD